MTIDEIIRVMEFFLYKQCDLGRMKYTPYDDQNIVWEAVNTIFKEWQWYREQYLIRREDVPIYIDNVRTIFEERFSEQLPQSCIATLDAVKRHICDIPKAEPPTSSKMEQVERSIPTEWAGRDSASIPYTPKE